MKKLSLVSALPIMMVVLTISMILFTYKMNVVSTFVSMKVPADVSNSAWVLSVMIILGVFGGLIYKENNI
jgi:divalent metal cation (Fe/Co/Zn/Cd) transporter